MTRLFAALALVAVTFAFPRDRRQVFLQQQPVAAPAIVGAQQSPGGHVTGASASIKIHASPAIKTPLPAALAAVPVAIAAPVATSVVSAAPAAAAVADPSSLFAAFQQPLLPAPVGFDQALLAGVPLQQSALLPAAASFDPAVFGAVAPASPVLAPARV